MVKNKAGFFLLLLWSSMIIFLHPIPTEQFIGKAEDYLQEVPDLLNDYLEEETGQRSKEVDSYKDKMPSYSELKSLIQFRWANLLIAVFVGVIGSIFAILGYKIWKILITISAILFFIHIYKSLPGLLPTKSNLSLWSMVFSQAFDADSAIGTYYLKSIYKELIFPIVQIVILACLVISALWNKTTN